jgi:hypothetical protein
VQVEQDFTELNEAVYIHSCSTVLQEQKINLSKHGKVQILGNGCDE